MNKPRFEIEIEKAVGVPVKSNSIKVNGYDIHYVTAGKGKPLLLLHSFVMGWGHWYKTIAALAKHCKVYALDMPGYGMSTKVDIRNADLERLFIDTVEKFIKAKRLRDVNIIGHSFGAWIALKLVTRGNKNINKLVLESPSGFSYKILHEHKPISFYPVAKLLSRTAMKSTIENNRKFLGSSLYDKSSLPDPHVRYMTNSIKNGSMHPLLILNKVVGLLGLKKEFNLVDSFPNIENPVLVVLGDSDPLLQSEKIINESKLLQNSKANVFKNTGHVPAIEQQSKYNKLVVDFLSDN